MPIAPELDETWLRTALSWLRRQVGTASMSAVKRYDDFLVSGLAKFLVAKGYLFGKPVYFAVARCGVVVDYDLAISLAHSKLSQVGIVVVGIHLNAVEFECLKAAGLQFVAPQDRHQLRGLRTRFSDAPIEVECSCWSPLSQSILISALLQAQQRFVVGLKLAELGFSRSRARLVAREIAGSQVAVVDWGVKGYLMEIDEPEIAWSISERFLSSPVQKIIQVRGIPHSLPEWARLAGRSAMKGSEARATPSIRRLAVHWEDADLLPESPIGHADEVELWSTPPAALAGATHVVDPISLYLSAQAAWDPILLNWARRRLISFWAGHRP